MMHVIVRDIGFKEYEPQLPEEMIRQELNRVIREMEGRKLTASSYLEVQHRMSDYFNWKLGNDHRFNWMPRPIWIEIFGERFKIG